MPQAYFRGCGAGKKRRSPDLLSSSNARVQWTLCKIVPPAVIYKDDMLGMLFMGATTYLTS
jgi:hypothetical protein